jgi:hypothetical protein
VVFDSIWWFLGNGFFFSDGLGYFYIFEKLNKFDVYQTYEAELGVYI